MSAVGTAVVRTALLGFLVFGVLVVGEDCFEFGVVLLAFGAHFFKLRLLFLGEFGAVALGGRVAVVGCARNAVGFLSAFGTRAIGSAHSGTSKRSADNVLILSVEGEHLRLLRVGEFELLRHTLRGLFGGWRLGTVALLCVGSECECRRRNHSQKKSFHIAIH